MKSIALIAAASFALLSVVEALNPLAAGQVFKYDTTTFEEWEIEHGKQYESPEKRAAHKKSFLENVEKMREHNSDENNTHLVDLNHYGDLTVEEYASNHQLYTGSSEPFNRRYPAFKGLITDLPVSVDWRDCGAVTPIKNQGQCGSCYSFAATGAMEGQYFLRHGELKSFSEQQIVDCSDAFHNGGCNGGNPGYAFRYYQEHGAETEEDYPYHARDTACVYNKNKEVEGTKTNGTIFINRASELDLQDAIANIGPITVAIDANSWSFQFYRSGVYYNPHCSQWQLDHSVLAIGYGVMDGKEYYLVKNSWGTGWGDKGFILMSRNKGNMCGIATDANYPELA